MHRPHEPKARCLPCASGRFGPPRGSWSLSNEPGAVHVGSIHDSGGALVARLRALGATDIDVGQGDVPWTCLADPEGNEFDVLTPL